MRGSVSPVVTSPAGADVLPPRVVIAGTHSGVGKTTVTAGLLAALRRAGVRVASAKVGPDYIDPGYHQLATGRPSRNLDLWMCGHEAVLGVAARAAAGADLLVVEGVMGLFDAAGDGSPSSTAHVAQLLRAPVVLVVDAGAMSGSVAALVHGFRTFDPGTGVAGVILNRVGSAGHEMLLREALADCGVPVLGALHRDDRLVWRDRHLGLVPVVERSSSVAGALDVLAATIGQRLDLRALSALAGTAPPLTPQLTADVRVSSASSAGSWAPTGGVPVPPSPAGAAAVRIAVAAGAAFSFTYPDNLEALEAAGAELVPFDPLRDEVLPEALSGLVVGGGFPEVYAEQLAANPRLLADVRRRIDAGLVTWAECGGLLWLARRLDGHPMAGVVAADGSMTSRLTLGYRTASVQRDTPLGPAGTTVRGHEFHYSTTEPAGDALHLVGRHGEGAAGFAGSRLLASYLHVHLAGRQDLANSFVERCRSALPVPYLS